MSVRCPCANKSYGITQHNESKRIEDASLFSKCLTHYEISERVTMGQAAVRAPWLSLSPPSSSSPWFDFRFIKERGGMRYCVDGPLGLNLELIAFPPCAYSQTMSLSLVSGSYVCFRIIQLISCRLKHELMRCESMRFKRCQTLLLAVGHVSGRWPKSWGKNLSSVVRGRRLFFPI